MALLPSYFYDINAMLPEGRPRWVDEFADEAPSVLQLKDFDVGYARRKRERNIAYSKWLASKFVRDPQGNPVGIFKPKQMIWQAIRILERAHSENNSLDWWGDYRDAVFRVFVQPETLYDHYSREHKQWYVLSPEDSYLVNRREIEKAGEILPPREYNGRERWLSGDVRLRTTRVVPVECCHHLRHETTGGVLPEGL